MSTTEHDQLWGGETTKAVANFPISGEPIPAPVIHWLGRIKAAAALVEEIAGEWLKELLGIPAGASFAFVTGCQMAHVTCLAAARRTGRRAIVFANEVLLQKRHVEFGAVRDRGVV